MITPQDFGEQLSIEWRKHTARMRFYEVRLFRALRQAILSLSGPFHIDEFHGSKHQVAFGGVGSWARPIARCELSDLLVVTYAEHPSFKARMTFLQAKRSFSEYQICGEHPRFRTPVAFKANLEQWDVLRRRPWIIGVPPFEPPGNLLQGALLPSVGTFGVFYRRPDKSVDLLYASADALTPRGQPTRRYGTVQAVPGPSERGLHGYQELRLSCCIKIFGVGLFSMKVGTPVDHQGVVSAADQGYRESARRWLSRILDGHMAQAAAETPTTQRLLRLFEVGLDEPPLEGPLPSVIVIKTNAEGREAG